MNEDPDSGGAGRPDGGAGPSAQALQSLERQARSGGPAGDEARRALAALAADPTLPRPLAKELRRVIYRLRSAGIELDEPHRHPQEGGRALPVQAAASGIEADGSAVIVTVWVVRETNYVFSARVSDGRGFEEADVREVARRRASAEVEEAVRSGLMSFEPSWGAMMLAGARALAMARRAGFPRAYVLAQDWLDPALSHEAEPTPYGWAAGEWSSELRSALGADPQRLEMWARGSSSLASDPEVRDWDLTEALAPFLAEARRQLATRLELLPGTRQAIVERLAFRMSEALHAPPHRGLLGARLAYVTLRLERSGRLQEARLAAAASRVLRDQHAAVRVGALEALSARHLRAYLPSPQPERTGVGPGAAAGPSRPARLLLPPGAMRSGEGG